MPDPELLKRMSQKTRINVLVAEAQEGELSTSQLVELADLLSVDAADRTAITQAVIEKLVILRMPAGRIEDLRSAFSAGSPGPVPGRPPTDTAAAAAAVKTYSSQQTRPVTSPFKVPFEHRAAQTTTIQPKVPAPPPEAEQPAAAAEPPAPQAEPPEPGEPGEQAQSDKPPLTESQSVEEWQELQAELLQLADITKPKPPPPEPPPPPPAQPPQPPVPARQPTAVQRPRGPLPLRGKAAQILNRGAAAAPPLPRTPAAPPAKSSAEPPMRRDTMHFGSRVTAAQPMEEEQARKPVILVADDDARIRMVFRLKLEQKGFRPIEAPNGAEAWKVIEQGGIDAVVLDMKMPGLHGLEVLQRLVNTKRDIPVVICTAYDRLDDEFVVATYPKLRYLTKPVDADHLVETLTNLLAEQG